MSNATKTRTYYTCVGDVRGTCGIQHRTEAAADACCARDAAACRGPHYRAGSLTRAYSDRSVVEREAEVVARPALRVTIEIREEGQAFGCRGLVRAGNGRTLAETRLYPYGMDAQARAGAEAIVAERGYEIVAAE